MIGTAEFERMKNTAVLVNTSRSRVVDTEALYLALKNGQIAAAGVDVYDSEPIAENSPLLELENIAMTPHIGSASHETREGMALMAVENMLAALDGKMPPNPVNPEVFEK